MTKRGPQITPTTVDLDSTTERSAAPLPSDPPTSPRKRPPTPSQRKRPPTPKPAAQATLPESDPATALVRRSDFVELPPGSVVGDVYEIDARLGAGAMGEVYAAHHIRLGKRVAVKVIGEGLSEDSASIERFAQEAQTLAKIQHPAIVAVDHVGELADGRAFFVMELLRGEPLFERIHRGRIPLREALSILDQMARGLEAAHAQGVVHRDLKPENTFLVHLPGEPPMVKILDFGLSKLAADVDRRAEKTQSGVAIGTPMYMSPEQARGRDVDHRTDIYALGVVAYELILGRPPFPHARTAPEHWAAHLSEAPPLPRSIWPEIPPQLDLVLFALIAKDPAHRPTLAQVRAVIAAVRDESRQSQRAATEIVRPRPTRPTHAVTIAISVLAMVVGVAIGMGVVRKSSETQPSPPEEAKPSEPTQLPIPPLALALDLLPPAPAPQPTADVKPHVHPTRPSTPRQAPRQIGSAAIGNAEPATPPADLPPPLPRIESAPRPRPEDKKPIVDDKNLIVDPFAKRRNKENHEQFP